MRKKINKGKVAEKITSHFVFWVVVLLLTSPLWLPSSCMGQCDHRERSVYQVKIGGAMVIAEVEQ